MIKNTLNTFLLVAIVLLSVNLVKGQTCWPDKVKPYLPLTGEVHILTFFIDTKFESWNDGEIEYYFGELLKSQDWLSDEASCWRQKLAFDNGYFFEDQKSIVYLDDVPVRENPNRTLQMIINEIGYDNFDDFLEQNGFDYKTEKLKVVLFVKSNDRSHAYNYGTLDGLDLAIVYCGSSTDHYVISHELLHQFGACDLYYEFGRSQTIESAEIAKEKYPNSIMINNYGNKDELVIDEVTAWRVGWEEWRPEFNLFDPMVNKEKIEDEYIQKNSNGKNIKFDLKKKERIDKN